MEQTNLVRMKWWTSGGATYSIRRKKATMRPCWAFQAMERFLFSALTSASPRASLPETAPFMTIVLAWI